MPYPTGPLRVLFAAGLALLVFAAATRAERAPGSLVPLDAGAGGLFDGVGQEGGGFWGAAPAMGLALAPVAPLGTVMSGRRSTRDRRCTEDGAHCIALASYVPDVCRTLEATAREAGLDAHFFARLIWRESLFDANAVSHAGAEGIAQFMPGTAAIRGLEDAFNPAEALRASARYLAELRDRFGNLGLAAAAYNGGERRVSRYLSGQGGLPGETRAYVAAITGLQAARWRDGRPTPDLRLDADTPFVTACGRLARGHEIAAFAPPPDLP